MASTLTVDNIVGATSSSNIHIPGHVIGFASAEQNGQGVLSSTTFVSISLDVTYTAKRSDSKLIVSWQVPIELYDSGSNSEVIGDLALYKDGSALGTAYRSLSTMQNSVRSGMTNTATYVFTTGDTSSHTWSVYANVNQDSNTVFRYSRIGTIMVMEIAQ